MFSERAKGKNGYIIQIVFFAIFFFLNVVIFSFSATYNKTWGGLSPTYWNASDGQRYWGVAINIAEKGEFTVVESSKYRMRAGPFPALLVIRNEEPLSRAGPLPALVFSVPIKLFGVNNAALWIVLAQCIFLFFSGLLARGLCVPYHANKNIIQALIIFNPSLITLAHHAQSEIIFLLLMTMLLVCVSNALRNFGKWQFRNFVIMGLIAGLLPLARPLGFYFILMVPLFMTLALMMPKAERQVDWRRFFRGIILSVTVAALTMTPWAIRNNAVFGQFSLTQSEGIMMEWHYRALRNYQPHEQVLISDETPSRFSCSGDIECKDENVRAYLYAIGEVGVGNIVRALLISWGKLFFTGGVSQLGRYMDLGDTPTLYNFMGDGRSFGKEIQRVASSFELDQVWFVVLLILAVGFSVVCRVLGLIGLIVSTRDKTMIGHTVFYLGTISIFLAMYLFSSIARFRVPLEPILMLFATIGISYIFRVGKNSDPRLQKT